MNITHMMRLRDVLADIDVLKQSPNPWLRNFKFRMDTLLSIDETRRYKTTGCILGLAYLLHYDEDADGERPVLINYENGRAIDINDFLDKSKKYVGMEQEEWRRLGHPHVGIVDYNKVTAKNASQVIDNILHNMPIEEAWRVAAVSHGFAAQREWLTVAELG